MLFKFFSPNNVKTKLPFSFTKTANYLRLAANPLSIPTPQTPSSHQETHNVGFPQRSALWDLGSLAFQKKLVPTLAVELPSLSYKILPSTRPLPCAFVSTSLSCGWVCPCASRGSWGARGFGGNQSESAPSNPALNTSTLFKDSFGLCLSSEFCPAISWPFAIAHHYITMNFPRVPSSLPRISLEGVEN